MTRSRRHANHLLTRAQADALDAGRVITWSGPGRSRVALGRDPGDGRYLWSVSWPTIPARLVDAPTNTWSLAVQAEVVQGKLGTITEAQQAIVVALRDGRPPARAIER